MFVSDELKCIFVHNPKAAGMAIKKAMWEHEKWNLRFDGETNINGEDVSLLHPTMEQVHRLFPDVIEKMHSYYTFMVIRNPFTRYISSFNYKDTKAYLRYCEDNDLIAYRNAFEEFTENLTKDHISTFKYIEYIRQVDMAYHNSDTLIDAFLIFEDLPGCLKQIEYANFLLFQRLKRMKFINMRPMNVGPQQIYSEKTKNKVLELYAADFDTFRYSKNL